MTPGPRRTYRSSRLGEDDAPDAAPADAVEQHARVARGLPAHVERGAGELLDLGLVAVVRQATGVLADDQQLVGRQHEVAREVLEVLDLDDGVALVDADLP